MTVPRRVDVKVDGKTVLANQRVDNAQVWSRVTRQGKLGHRVEVIPVGVTPPPPKPPDDSPGKASHTYLDPVRNLLVFATVTDDAIQHACKLPSSWKFLFTADPAYPVTDQQIAAAAATGHGTFAWGDCHSPALYPGDIQAFQRARDLSGWYGEGESSTAFAVAALATRPEPAAGVIVNLSALLPGDLALIAFGKVLVAAENYRNKNPNEEPDWRNANKGIGGNVLACYGSTTEGATYTPLEVQHKNGWFDPAVDSLFTEGMLDQDWVYLRSIA